jgi:hypothetical protein
MNNTELLSQLRKFVLMKSGLRTMDPAHCKTISEYVFKETKNYVSETTVKRFFGFAQTVHKFSLFTLNSLAQYVGYADWEGFCKDKEDESADVSNIWQDLKLKCQSISDVSLIAKKNNSGVPFEATANRSFLYADFEYFLKNNYQFTTISAHPGHGKSILLAHLIEHFFYRETAPYKKDIVLLINAASVGVIIQNGLSLKDWFQKEFKFGSVTELITYFKKNPNQREGRFILVIDGIDQYLDRVKYFNIFVDFLKSIQESGFIKIVLGLRTNSWVNLQPSISGSAFLTKAWYKGLFYEPETLTNVPALNQDEILQTLSKIEGITIHSHDLHQGLLKQFRTPFWLQVYYQIKKENNSLQLNSYLLCYELISYFLENKIFLSKKSTEKSFILKEISNEISEGGRGLRVAKENILNYINCYPEAYEELIYGGILIEEKRLSTSIPTEVIRFLSNDIYTYFLFVQLNEKFNYKASFEYFQGILNVFANQPMLREHMLNWSIRFCVNRNNIEPLKSIFRLPFSNVEKNYAFDFICNVATYELDKANSNFNSQTIDHHFTDVMVAGKIISKKYKETIKKIAENIFSEDIHIMLQVIDCTISITDSDKAGLIESMQLLKRNYKRLNDLFPINPYDLILFFYNILSNKPNESKTLNEKIIKLCRSLDHSKPMKNGDLTSQEMLVYRLILIILFAQKDYAECHRFAMAIVKKYPNIFYLRSSVFPSFLLLTLGQNYLKLRYYKKAQRIVQFLEKIIDGEFTYHTPYIKTSFFLLKANFYNFTGNHLAALKEAKEGIMIARSNQLRILEISLRLVYIEALRQSGMEENVAQAIKDLLNFLNNHKLTMPDFVNLNDDNFDHTFNILKSYK